MDLDACQDLNLTDWMIPKLLLAIANALILDS
jgi:hypothetical protein